MVPTGVCVVLLWAVEGDTGPTVFWEGDTGLTVLGCVWAGRFGGQHVQLCTHRGLGTAAILDAEMGKQLLFVNFIVSQINTAYTL